ncbi:alpha/beta hydrolase [Spirosoma arcticum]
MKTLLLSLILIGIALPSLFGQANSSPVSVSQSVSTDSIYSTILKRKVATTIILPANYDATKSYPVFYLLHRWSGNNGSFLKSNLIAELKDKPLIIVTPSADTSWYVNSATNPANRYEDFMTLELFDYIDKKYRTNSTRQAIGGFSMGAFGALQIGLKHPERFTFIADMSGPINAPFYDVPLTPKSPLNFIKNSVRVSFGEANSPVATGSNVFRLVKSVPASSPVFIYMAVGKQDEFDFIIPQHQLFIDALKKQGINYQYTEYEGGHFDGKVLTACLPTLLNKLTDTLK